MVSVIICQARIPCLANRLGSARLDNDLQSTYYRAAMAAKRRHPAVEQFLQEIGRTGGSARAKSLSPRARRSIARSGGQARATKLTAEQRSASARKASLARWKKEREKKQTD